MNNWLANLSEQIIFANIFLIVGYIIFRFLFFRSDSFIAKNSKSDLLKVSRIFILVLLLSPTLSVFVSLPKELPRIETGDYIPLSEEIDFEIGAAAAKSVGSILLTDGQQARDLFDLNLILLTIFLFGMVWRSFLVFRSLRGLSKLSEESTLFRQISSLKILISGEKISPFSYFSISGSRIVVPIDFLMKKRDLKNILRHEFQHIRQGDVHWAWFLEALKIVFWFNPAIYFWIKDLSEMSELACDEKVLREKKPGIKSYGTTLIHVAEYFMEPKPFFAATTRMTGVGDESTALLRRIKMLKKSVEKKRRWMVYLSGVTSIGIVLVFGLMTRASSTPSEIETHPKLQAFLEDSLKEGLEKADAVSGFGILSDPRTGEIMAISHLSRENGQVTNESVSKYLNEPYEPFSTFKPVVAAISMEGGGVNEDDVLDARGGKFAVNGRQFFDWKNHGMISVKNILAQSSNVGAFRITEWHSDSFLYRETGRIGFGPGGVADGTGFSSPGRIKMTFGEDKFFNSAYLAYGMQNVSVTALEILQVYSAFANGGFLNAPKPFGDRASVQSRLIFKKSTIEQIQRALRASVTDGTAKRLNNSRYKIAGKTGTGLHESIKTRQRAHFIGYAPFDAPRLIAYVLVDRDKKNTHGSGHAAPIVQDVLEKSLDFLKR